MRTWLLVSILIVFVWSKCPANKPAVTCEPTPCEGIECPEGTVCVNDYCGGCNYQCRASLVPCKCNRGQFCSSKGCLPHGFCYESDDCKIEKNLWYHRACIGYEECIDEICAWTCDDPYDDKIINPHAPDL
eukprot:TRINITY_DN2188_c0_g1_i3.p1 TRINITY_DN2188_c0_g1~~TRINITY_DN2188_c0_g1_i3.p1  ORF type:complete len:143 (-),score=2.69 TRINITY_DN2188_c0_g1_i3:120-512(-)